MYWSPDWGEMLADLKIMPSFEMISKSNTPVEAIGLNKYNSS